jgi:hypothetical protein
MAEGKKDFSRKGGYQGGFGINGLLVGDWIKTHADEVISHNSKYKMQNAKDASKTETYYNKRHGSEKITKILNLINEQFLDSEALKSQQSKPVAT